MSESHQSGSSIKSERASSDDVRTISSHLPFLIPHDKVKTIRSLGRDFKPIVGFEIKGQKFLVSIIESVTEYLVSAVEALSWSDPERAKIVAESLEVPIVVLVEGRKETMTHTVPLKHIIELRAKQSSSRVIQSYKTKFNSRVLLEDQGKVEKK